MATAKAANIVQAVRLLNTQLVELHSQLQKTLGRYNHNGAGAFIKPFFMQEDGTTPRTDLDVTEQQILSSLANQQLVFQRLDNLLATFIQAE